MVTIDPVGFTMRLPLRPHELTDQRTRAEDTNILCHLGVPRIETADWSLAVGGLVRKPRQFTLEDLRGFERVEVASFHQCAGNPLDPTKALRLVGNVAWGGVRLADVLAACEPLPEAHFVWSIGADHGSFADVACESYVKDLPIDRVGADVLLAYELNGEPLRAENGFPVRLLVPGFYGTNSVKWIVRIELADRRADGPFTTLWYNDRIRAPSGEATGETRPVWAVAPESILVAPADGATLERGKVATCWGWAWADGGVADVEVTVDDGATWQQARLEPPSGREWQRFEIEWTPHGEAPTRVGARAANAKGEIQSADGARNAVHWVTVSVV